MFSKSRKKLIDAFKSKVRLTIKEGGYTQTFMPFDKTANDYIIKHTKLKYPECDSGLPVPPKGLRAGYEEEADEYIKNSKTDVGNMLKILESSDFKIEGHMKILDFGCSTGRMVRSLKPYAKTCEIWGTDVNADHIYWNNQYLNPPFKFATTTFNPHLPFEDKYFNLIYSGSVFTHIDNFIESWLLELKRILADSGRLYITIHDNHTLEIFEKNKKIALSEYFHNHDLFDEAKKDFDFFVFNRAKSPQVFFDLEYFKKLIDPMFEILSVNYESYGYQTGILLKRK
ncbi:MAG TPA: class I SAM-dependent methyltransferase [Ignavibacteria bacterium]|nr:class I SAM-dependent methyltransferase [Ignavibacteria bacterium]